VAIVVLTQRRTLLAALGLYGQLRPGWLAAAFAAEVGSFVLAAELQHELLRAARVRLGRAYLLAVTYAGAAVSRTIPGGAAVSVGYTYRRLLRRGVGAGVARWTLVASGIVSLSTLAVIGIVAAQLRGIGVVCSAAGALAAAAVIAGVVCTIALLAWGGRNASRFERIGDALSRRVDRALRVFAPSVRSTPATTVSPSIDVRLWDWLRACGLSAANWLADVLAIGMTFLAVGIGAPWSKLLWAYVVIQLIAAVPILGCIGLAEGSMTLALVSIGVRPTPALAVVLVYRLLTFWLTIPLGWFASRYVARAESTEPRTATAPAPPGRPASACQPAAAGYMCVK
jgi:uncharacterized membrane protein YbhN (UPF0104 family)